MINIERTDKILKDIRNNYEKAILCENAEERNDVYSALLPQVLVIAELLLIEKMENDR